VARRAAGHAHRGFHARGRADTEPARSAARLACATRVATPAWLTNNHCADQAVGDARSPTPRSNGTAKIEILGGSTAEPHTTIDSLDDSFGVEEYHHFCLNVADVTLAELRSRGVEVLGDAIDLEAKAAAWASTSATFDSPDDYLREDPAMFHGPEVPVLQRHHHLRVVPYTIDDEPAMQRVIDLGVNGIISDDPDLLTLVARRNGLA
jgi:hypothetical protein